MNKGVHKYHITHVTSLPYLSTDYGIWVLRNVLGRISGVPACKGSTGRSPILACGNLFPLLCEKCKIWSLNSQ